MFRVDHKSLFWLVVAAVVAAGMPSRAPAQTVDSDVRNELKTERRDQLRSLRIAPPPKEFDVSVTVPFTYNTNPGQNPGSGEASWHWSPDVAAGWRRQFEWARLSTRANVSFDRYTSQHDLDADEAWLLFKAELTDGNDYRWTPYVSYRPDWSFTATFDERVQTTHDFAAGISNMFYLSDAGAWIARRAARMPGATFFGFDISAGYRYSDPEYFSATFLKAKLPFRVVVNERVIAGVQPTLTARWYPDYKGTFRRDFRPGGNVGITWSPEGFDSWELSAGAQYTRTFSTRAKSEFSQWDIGPTVSFRVKF
jgi:hypothetical protein